MLCHWRYVLDHLFGGVKSVACTGATHIPKRYDESGKAYEATGEDAAYATFELEHGAIAQINSSWCTRVRRDDLATFHVDGTLGSAVAGLTDCFIQPRAATPKPVWNPDVPQSIDFFATWQKMPDTRAYDNAFKAEWELFLRHGRGSIERPCSRRLSLRIRDRCRRRQSIRCSCRAAMLHGPGSPRSPQRPCHRPRPSARLLRAPARARLCRAHFEAPCARMKATRALAGESAG